MPGFAVGHKAHAGIKTYQDAAERLGTKTSRKLENNTYLERTEDGGIAVRLHATRVVTYRPDGSCVLNSGGFRTTTTKDRINRYSPVPLHTDGGVWYIGNWLTVGPKILYHDGLTIAPNGAPGGLIETEEDRAKVRQLKQDVKTYCDGFTTALDAGDVPQPSGADCWGCWRYSIDGLPLVALESGHIREHVRESYYVPSLLVRALEAAGAGPAWKEYVQARMVGREPKFFGLGSTAPKYIRKMLRRYIMRQLGFQQ